MKKVVKKENKNIGEGLGISGLTLSILGIIFLGVNGLLLLTIGFIFCFVQQRKNPTKIGKAGLITSIIGIILNISFLVFYFFYLAPLVNQLGL